MDDWPALQLWTPEFFERKYGDLQVTVRRCHARSDSKRIALREYIRYLSAPAELDPYYLGNWKFENDCPELRSHYRPPVYFESWHEQLPSHLRPCWRWMFIGPSGAGTHMHVDVAKTSAWNAVTYGAKRWVFFPPDQEPLLYRGEVDAFNPDLAKFPDFGRVIRFECVQEPGGIVFTPSGWWHQVRNESACIAVTENFINEINIGKVDRILRQAVSAVRAGA